jgi:hypothetical protein
MDAKVTWKHNLAFTGTANSGFTIPLAPAPRGGKCISPLLGLSPRVRHEFRHSRPSSDFWLDSLV